MTAKDVIRRAKALGDAMDGEREEREARLREAGFEEPEAEQRKANLATNVALMSGRAGRHGAAVRPGSGDGTGVAGRACPPCTPNVSHSHCIKQIQHFFLA